MEQIAHNPKLREKISVALDNDVSLGLSGTHNSIGFRVAEIEKHFHNSEPELIKSSTEDVFINII